MEPKSEINPGLNLKKLRFNEEDLYFDRKSKRIKPKDLAVPICAFANANGGTIAIGIEDKGKINGFNESDTKKINEFEKVPYDFCNPMPRFNFEKMIINNDEGHEVIILLVHVKNNPNKITYDASGDVYLRVGDSSKKLQYDEIKSLEYDKGEQLFEEELIKRANLEDIDNELFESYRKKLKSDLGRNEILEARGLLINENNQKYLTVAGVVLFCKHPEKFLPNSRLRFLRYEGTSAETGIEMNLIKDITIYGPLQYIILEAKNVISSQLRDFTSLNPVSGTFESVPEYPEFAWLEGIVNAITHRDYSIKGDHIRVTMYDDRLEITSPGKLPNVVTINNLKTTRYSRNPQIARILFELGWVKELNEGVKRIYKEMNAYFLEEPIFDEPNDNSVKLTLKNNIIMRRIRNSEKLKLKLSKEVWENLNSDERTALLLTLSKGKLTTNMLSGKINRSDHYTRNILKKLTKDGLLKWNGTSTNDPKQYYHLDIE